MYIEHEKRLLPHEDVVRDYAVIGCSCGQPLSYPKEKWDGKYLRVGRGHGVSHSRTVNNQLQIYYCAHDETCIPFTNIPQFTACYSTRYIPAVRAMRAADEKERQMLEQALRQAKDQEGLKYNKTVPCLLKLLDRWFEEEETQVVTDYYDFCKDFLEELNTFDSEIRDFFPDVKERLNLIWTGARMQEDIDRERLLTLEELDHQIDALYNNIIAQIGELRCSWDDAYLGEGEFSHAREHILTLFTRFEAMSDEIDVVIRGFKNITGKEISDLGGELVSWKNDFENRIRNLKEELSEWDVKEYHLITKNSKLVCQCGGIIEVLDTGARFQRKTNRFSKILKYYVEHDILICEKEKELCEQMYEGEKAAAYEIAIKNLKAIQKMLENDIIITTDETVNIEFIPNSFFENRASMAKGLLGLLCLLPQVPSWLITVVAIANLMGKKADEVSTKEVVLLGFDAADQLGAFKSISLASQVNTLFGAVSAMQALAYLSPDDWIRQIRITIFSETHAYTSSIYLNEEILITKGPLGQGVYKEGEYRDRWLYDMPRWGSGEKIAEKYKEMENDSKSYDNCEDQCNIKGD